MWMYLSTYKSKFARVNDSHTIISINIWNMGLSRNVRKDVIPLFLPLNCNKSYCVKWHKYACKYCSHRPQGQRITSVWLNYENISIWPCVNLFMMTQNLCKYLYSKIIKWSTMIVWRALEGLWFHQGETKSPFLKCRP